MATSPMRNADTASDWLAQSGLAGMPQDTALEYLRSVYGGADIRPLLEDQLRYGPWLGLTPEQQSQLEQMLVSGVALTPSFDPSYEGGVYGHYNAVLDDAGKVKDIQFQKDSRHDGWLSENLDTIGPLLVGGAAFGFPALFGTQGAAGLSGGLLTGGSAMQGMSQAFPGLFGSAGAAGTQAPISESLISNLGPSATYKDSLQYLMANGFTEAEAAGLLQTAATDVLTGVTGPVTGALPEWISSAALAMPNGANLLKGFQTAADAAKTVADAGAKTPEVPSGVKDVVKDAVKGAGDAASGLFDSLGGFGGLGTGLGLAGLAYALSQQGNKQPSQTQFVDYQQPVVPGPNLPYAVGWGAPDYMTGR